MNGRVILTLGVFKYVAYVRMRCVQLRAAILLSPKNDADDQTEIQRDIHIDRHTDR